MRIAVLGTGEVGRRLAGKLVSLGHKVTMGSRTADNADATQWASETGGAHGTFADACARAELVVNATGGLVSLAVLEAAGAENLRGKTIVDVSNALDFSEGFPPKVVTPDGHSIAEQLQKAFPDARVVKTLNTMNNAIMVEPARVPGLHNVFVSGDDADAKAETTALLRSFGWAPEQITDLGDLSSARATEALMALWLRLYGVLGPVDFNLAVVTA
ncbi:NADPH-dependent F420 reductase [Streptomyces turgidiscabies]|uniref:Dinucleotide-binding enzyme n=1 Tax=Streptomyces turgidiscabies TaxID=85558 RepID=A0ABU0RVI0_9ACTN|nr:NAD(P)-binding domain-containing protein [Streptomyces turgidiscabies]MDQ0936011.1 putative dinucleotide-binding enzyme [Streptomyces turgidiscabies]